MLKITTKDAQVIEVSQDMRKMSKLIDESLMDDESEVSEITVTEVKSLEVNLIIDYCKHFEFNKTASDIEKPLVSKDPKVFIKDEWEREFIDKLDLDAKCELLMAANYFNIPAIFELCCATIAAFFKGKDFDKIKGDFGLQDVTYTPEDEEKLKAEYPWIQEQAEKKIAEIQAEIEKKAQQ
mgnify:CR=1 FL=1|jgi:hypothetical protein